MAQIRVPEQAPPTKIDRFLGLNEDTSGDTQLQLGESPNMINWRLTENYKLRKREGYSSLFNALSSPLQGIWEGKINSINRFLFACDGHIWSKQTLSGTSYDSIDLATYTDVDVVKTTALLTPVAGTSALDGFTIVKNTTELTEVAAADIDLVASIGKYYYHTDKSLWFIVAKGAYADIATARTGIGESTVYVQLGDLTDAKTEFFAFGDKVYFQNEVEYKSWNGTLFQDVAGYVPLIATATPPAGGGTNNEQLNLLTGKKRQRFSADSSATAYQIRELSVTSVDVVEVNGTTLVEGVDYTVNLTTGIITFSIAPTVGVDNVEIAWTKGTGQRSEVTGHRFNMFFGGRNDTRVFLYGNGTNRYIYTGLANGVPSAEYFPALNFNEVGSSQFEVTDIIRQYDRQIIFTNGQEAYFSFYETIEISGDVIPIFPTFTLNDALGNIAKGQAQLIINNPFTIQTGVYEWVATDVRDERNAVEKSKRVQPSLDVENLSEALTVDWESRKEYWLVIEDRIWVFNYQLDVWYKFKTEDEIACLYVSGDKLYFGTPNGEIMLFDSSNRTDNGAVIKTRWEMNFYDFMQETLRKFLNRVWVSLQPGTKEKVDVTWQTNNKTSSQVYTIEYSLIDFNALNFADFSFLTFYNPQPFRLKVKAKKFVYFKLILVNESLTANATVLSINLLSRAGGETK